MNSKSEKLLNPLIKRLPYLFVGSLLKRQEGGGAGWIASGCALPKKKFSTPKAETCQVRVVRDANKLLFNLI